MPERIAGKRGRRPSSIQHRFLSEFGVTLPAATYPIDVTDGYAAWQMLGNGPDPSLTGQYAQYAADGVGDCGDVAFQNDRTLSIALGKLPSSDLPTADGTLANYFAYTGGQDTGVDNSTFCPWLVSKGYCTGFARLTREQRDQWMSAIGRGVLTGVTLTDQDMQEFENGETWTCSGGQTPDPQEGHDILTVKAASPAGPHTCVTWAAEQEYDESWDNACADEWYALIVDEDKEWMGAEAYDAIIAYAQSVGGTTDGPDPAPAPEPTPAPTPTPNPTPPAGWVQRIKQDAEKVVEDIEELLEGKR